MNVDDRARAETSQEERPVLAPLAELERARLRMYPPDLLGNGPQSTGNTLPSPNLRLPPLLETSLASRAPLS